MREKKTGKEKKKSKIRTELGVQVNMYRNTRVAQSDIFAVLTGKPRGLSSGKPDSVETWEMAGKEAGYTYCQEWVQRLEEFIKRVKRQRSALLSAFHERGTHL